MHGSCCWPPVPVAFSWWRSKRQTIEYACHAVWIAAQSHIRPVKHSSCCVTEGLAVSWLLRMHTADIPLPNCPYLMLMDVQSGTVLEAAAVRAGGLHAAVCPA
jgi:hypothetical protein